MNSRTKGKRGELELCKAFRSLGLLAERTVQHEGRGSSGDVRIFGARIHTEGKRRRRLTVQQFMDQALADSAPHQVPLVVMRQDGGKFLAMFQLHELWELIEQLQAAKAHAELQACQAR